VARGVRIQEALALAEADLDHRRGALLLRRGKGGRRREVGMDARGWEELQPWLELRVQTAHRAALLRHQRSHPRPSVVERGRPRGPAPDPPPQPVCVDGSRHISSGTPTRS
jgi:integrase